ncbi:baseplate hub protein [Lichenibacterium dinghuense]|uniref:baseplate hub protein n=1 Tax=Lichenibacterium dinghuense TaxID=2895977 RepID=UPI001F2A1284|nr:hypothetical protein [Lichenibacterium sp. 6Y81]
MSFTRKHLQVDFALATGNFQGGGNSYSAKGMRITADIVKAGGVSMGGANVVVYGLPLSVMNQLSTYGQVLTLTGKNTVTVSAWEDGASPSVVFVGTIASASMDGQAQPQVGFHVEAYASSFENAKPVQPTSQPGSQDVATLMATVAQKAGLGFENNGVDVKVQNPYLPGTAIQQMHALADMARIERIVDCGTLAIWPANGSRKSRPAVISPQSGLVAYPQFNSQGIIFRALWQPSLAFGAEIELQSSMTPACGPWIVHKLTYALASETPNGPWFCDVWAHRTGVMPVA